MTIEILIVYLLLVGALISFIWERLPTDLTAALVFALLLVASYVPGLEDMPSTEQLLGIFANPAPLAIAGLFILSSALERAGGIDILASNLGKLTVLGYTGFMIVLILVVGVISAFINNTPVVMVFLPVVLSLSRKLGVPASKMLIPLSYASIFGGICTLVGTSTNVLSSSILRDAGMAPLGMFELAAVGGPIAILGLLYLVFIGSRILPHRDTLTALLSDEERREFLAEAFVSTDSSVAGKSPHDAGLTAAKGIRVVELVRHGVTIPVLPKETVLEEGDRLLLACRPKGVATTRSMEGINLGAEMQLGVETISAHEGALVEAVIGPHSSLVGHSIRSLRFRQRFRAIVVAIHRRGINLREKLEDTVLEFGDTLLMMGTEEALNDLRRSDDLLLLDRAPTPSSNHRRKLPIVLAITLALIGLASLSSIPIAALALVAAVLVMLIGVVPPKEAYQRIEWRILVLIYGMLGLGVAMQVTGGGALLAGSLASITEMGLPAGWEPYLLLGLIYLVTAVLTESLSNNATIVLMAPLALTLGAEAGYDPRPFLIAATVAASASFATPIGYQTNTYVYGAGGYKFTDFVRVGLPLNLLYFVGTLLLVPLFWKF